MVSILNHTHLRCFLLSPRCLASRTRLCTTPAHTISSFTRTFTHTSPTPTTTRHQPQKPFYITTPIFYPNASPHIGHLYSLVAADVLARYHALRGREVRFLAGTDEHGMKIQKAALGYYGEGGREKEFCDVLSVRFKDLAKKANISNTCFVRTSSEAHYLAVEDVWKKLYDKGYIYKSQYSGWYSVTDECFYTDAQVGPAPSPASSSTSSPTSFTSPSDTPTPASSSHSNPDPATNQQQYISFETLSPVEWTSEQNYMFRLSSFRPHLLSHILSSPTSIHPPQYRSQVLGWLGVDADGAPLSASDSEKVAGGELEDISISRPSARLSWGVQVPNDPEQTVYVWFDALLIYLSGAGYPWRTPEGGLDVRRMKEAGWAADVQVVGKDILRFHSLYLPAILLALNAGPYDPSASASTSTLTAIETSASAGATTDATATSTETIATTITTTTTTTSTRVTSPNHPPQIPLPRTLLTHAHWTSSGRKMSKSIGNVVDPMREMEERGVDGVRFYLMRVGGRWRGDVDWSPEQLDKHTKEITAQLGNYFLRIASPRIFARAVPTSQNVYEGLAEDLQRVFMQSTATLSSTTDQSPTTTQPSATDLSSTSTTDEETSISVAAPTEDARDPNYELLKMTRKLPVKVVRWMETCEAGMALGEVMEVLKYANKVVSEIEPWSKSTPPALVHSTRLVGLETLCVAGECLLPFIPETAGRLLEALDGGKGALRVGVLRAVELDEVDGSEVGEGGEGKGKEEREKAGREEMEKFWKRWNGREIKSVRLF